MADDEGRLFDPPPPVQPQGGDLYAPKKLATKGASYDENNRVRQLYKDHVVKQVELVQPGDEEVADSELGKARGAFVDALVALCEKENVAYYRGRKHGAHALGAKAARDSVSTQLRQFWAGRMLPDYMLVLVEATICDRTGHSLPGGFYSLQRRMVV